MPNLDALRVALVLSDPGVLALVAYKAVLEEIAKGQDYDPAAQLAREVLECFADEKVLD